MSVVAAPLLSQRALCLQFPACKKVLYKFFLSCNDMNEYLKMVHVKNRDIFFVYGWEW